MRRCHPDSAATSLCNFQSFQVQSLGDCAYLKAPATDWLLRASRMPS